jgi:hypothetical protein
MGKDPKSAGKLSKAAAAAVAASKATSTELLPCGSSNDDMAPDAGAASQPIPDDPMAAVAKFKSSVDFVFVAAGSSREDDASSSLLSFSFPSKLELLVVVVVVVVFRVERFLCRTRLPSNCSNSRLEDLVRRGR